MDFRFKTDPFEHQLREFEHVRRRRIWAHLWEMGTGKTKVILDQAAWNFLRGAIDTLIIAAPNDVHANWITEEAPIHLAAPWVGAYWRASPLAWERDAWKKALESNAGQLLRVLSFNIDGLSPKSRGGKEFDRLLRTQRCMVVIDESDTMKTPSATRTRFLNNRAKHAVCRRIMTGTFLLNSPMDAYSQMRFLDPAILGWKTFTDFKAYYGEFITETTRGGKNYPVLIGFRHMDEFVERLAKFSTVIFKKDCVDLPEKLYESRKVELTDEQRRMYRQLSEDGLTKIIAEDREAKKIVEAASSTTDAIFALLEAGAEERVRAENVLTLYVRLQQLLSGFVKDEDGKIHRVATNRYDVLLRTLSQVEGKAIIWCQYTEEIDRIMDLLGTEALRFDGTIPKSSRPDILRDFKQETGRRWLVAHPGVGGRGHTLVEAKTAIYFSQTFSRGHRAQSEDRIHRIGQTSKVLYIFLEAPGTIDMRKQRAQEDKKTMATDFMQQVADIQRKERRVNG